MASLVVGAAAALAFAGSSGPGAAARLLADAARLAASIAPGTAAPDAAVPSTGGGRAAAATSPAVANDDGRRAHALGLTSPAEIGPVRAALRSTRAALRSTRATLPQLPYHDYDGQFIFMRIHTAGADRGFRSYRRIGNGGPGWSHDWPDAESNLSLILRELTNVRALVSNDGGNILTFDDPRMFLYPIAYVSEPGEWRVEQREVEPLREYLLKGGFIIFDDFGGDRRSCQMCVLADNMKRVLPELDFMRMDGSESVFHSFFAIDPNTVQLLGESGRPDFWGLFEDNDRSKRLIAIAGNNGDLGESWEFVPTGFYAIDLRNEAFKFGVNYVVYAMTH